ncbi:MAG: YidC/Oxa1 family insertase periplasmic-domain containing protein [Pirellulales bacterium]
MEKRLALFCVLAAFIMGTHLLLNAWLHPPADESEMLAAAPGEAEPTAPGPAKDKGSSQDKAASGDSSKTSPTPDQTAAPAGKSTPEVGPADASAAPDKPPAPADAPPSTTPGAPESAAPPPAPPVRAAAPLVYASLGSLDPASGYRMLVTLSSRGAAVQRIEMTSPLYRDLEQKHGYLGHLALKTAPDGSGAIVGMVGKGTPAANAAAGTAGAPAGLAVGDILLSANGQGVTGDADLHTVLESLPPGSSLELKVRRGEQTLTYTATLARRPLDVIRPERQSDYEPLEGSPASFVLTLDTLATDGESVTARQNEPEIRTLPPLGQVTWEVVRAEEGAVEFRYEIPADKLRAIGHAGRLEIVKRYSLTAAPPDQRDNPAARFYHLDFTVEIRSLDVPSRQVAYRLAGPSGLPLEGWWYMNKSGARDVVVRTDGSGMVWKRAPEIYKQAVQKSDQGGNSDVPIFADNEPAANRGVRYIGVDANYFAVLTMPRAEDGGAGVFRRASAIAVDSAALVPKSHNRTLNTSFFLVSEVTTITPEQPLKHTFTVFAGPKDPDILAAYNQEAAEGRGYVSLTELNDYGWFGFVSRPLSRILHLFYDMVGNYGIAIVMLTLLVRSCMLPISHRATKNAQKMQELSPEIKKIAEKYKSEPEKRVKAQQELFRQHNYNPFGGCLLALCQLPIFIGLYRCLSIDIELRGASLFSGIDWCSNLSGPDMFLHWKAYLPGWLGDETGYLGPYFNVLPLVTIALFLVNQKLLTPPATDEQTRMQQQVMKFMTIFIGVMFFKVASGLCIYFVASSCWSLAEHKLLRKGRLHAAATNAPAAESGRRGGEDRSSKPRS